MRIFLSLLVALFLTLPAAFAQTQAGTALPPAGFFPDNALTDLNATYLQLTASPINTSYRIINLGAGLTATDNGAKSTYVIGLGPVLAYLNGTGATTNQTFLNAIHGASTKGDIMYYDGTNWSHLGIGSTTQVLSVVSGLPSWQPNAGGAPTSGTYLTTTNLTGTLPNSTQITQGSGIAITTSSPTTTVAVDSTVIRTTGAQSMAGPKTLSGGPIIAGATTTGLVLQGTSFNDLITMTDPAAARTVNIPDSGVSSANFVLDQGATTITGQKTFTAAPICASGTIDSGTSAHVLTLPATTDQVVCRATIDTLTNKTATGLNFTNGSNYVLLGVAHNLTFTWANPALAETYNWADVGTNCDVAMTATGTSYAGGSGVYANGSVLATVAAGSIGAAYVSGGTSAPSWTTLGTQGGGMGITDATMAAGDIFYYASGHALTRLPIGTAGQQLTVNAGATAPQWSNGSSANYNANQVLAGTAVPTASPAVPTNRLMVLADLPPVLWNQGRLYAVSGNPYGDSSASTSLFFGPTNAGALITLFNSILSREITQTFGEASLALSGLTAGTIYDVYVTSASSTTVSLSTVAWSGNTPPVRTTQDGRQVQNGSPQNLWVGAFTATDATHVADFTGARNISNAYNKSVRQISANMSSGWTYALATIRAIGGNSTNGQGRVQALFCDSQCIANVTDGRIYNSTSSNTLYSSGLGLDTTTAFSGFSGQEQNSGNTINMSVVSGFTWNGNSNLGSHFVSRNESCAGGGTATMAAGAGNEGIYGTIFNVINTAPIQMCGKALPFKSKHRRAA